MTVIVTDAGFGADDWDGPVRDLPGDTPLEAFEAALPDLLDAPMIRVQFGGFSDGRGFSLARRLREAGYAGRLRAAGPIIADQYAMARRVGFDEVEISADLARRQPEDQWLFRADWQDYDHRSRLAGWTNSDVNPI